MKYIITCILIIGSFILHGQNTPGTVNISVTTKPNGKDFSPKHVLAIWVEDNSDVFVKTLKLQADKRKQYLYTWNSQSAGNTTDASTGATLSSHTSHDLSWNCTNTNGEHVADGAYSILVEYTSEHKQGPITSLGFTKSGEQFTFQPTDETYFTDMDIVYTPESASGIAPAEFLNQLKVYPLPAQDQCFIDIHLQENTTIQLRVYSSSMQLVAELWNGALTGGKHSFSWDIESTHSVPGTYFVVLNGENIFSSRQLIVTNE